LGVFDLKDNFFNKNSNARKFLNSYALKWYIIFIWSSSFENKSFRRWHTHTYRSLLGVDDFRKSRVGDFSKSWVGYYIRPVFRRLCLLHGNHCIIYTWKRLFFSNRLNTDPFISIKLFDIIIMSNTLLWLLKATFSVVAWRSMMKLCANI